MGVESKVRGSESRFAAYVEAITSALGHADRVVPFRSYCAGLLLPGDRKSVEPMAARVQPGRVQAAHQSLHHFVAKAEWSDNAVLAAVRAHVLPIIEQRGPIGSGKILVFQAARRSFASGLSRPSNTAARTTATR